jgi:hypothetical protein
VYPLEAVDFVFGLFLIDIWQDDLMTVERGRALRQWPLIPETADPQPPAPEAIPEAAPPPAPVPEPEAPAPAEEKPADTTTSEPEPSDE